MIEDDRLDNPLVLDVFKVNSKDKNQYDLPFHYFGQIISSSFPLEAQDVLSPLGDGHGYEHLWLRSKGKNGKSLNQLGWYTGSAFRTLTMMNAPEDEFLFTQLGANDPEFNLRDDPSFIIRRKNTASTLFVSTVEVHGSYSPVTERALNSRSSIKNITKIIDTDAYTGVLIELTKGAPIQVFISNLDSNESQAHLVEVDGEKKQWIGPYSIQTLK
jgi:hypothetical protein